MINLIKKKGINPQDKSVLYFPQWTRVQTTNVQSLAKRVARHQGKGPPLKRREGRRDGYFGGSKPGTGKGGEGKRTNKKTGYGYH